MIKLKREYVKPPLRLRIDVIESIDELAKKENRKFNNMLETLVMMGLRDNLIKYKENNNHIPYNEYRNVKKKNQKT